MLEYNTLMKGARTIGTEAVPERISEILNGIASHVRAVQQPLVVTEGRNKSAKSDSRMYLWRALPYVLHYAYRNKVKYVSIEPHFGLGRKYDGKGRPSLPELRNPKNYAPVSELAPKTGMWGDYISLVPQDYIWLPQYVGASPIHTFDWSPIVRSVLDNEATDILCDYLPEGNAKSQSFNKLLVSANYPALIALLLGCFYQIEMMELLQKSSRYSLSTTEYLQIFRSDLWTQFKGQIIDFGFRAIYKSIGEPYKVEALDIKSDEPLAEGDEKE
jgi:hypothetical protein